MAKDNPDHHDAELVLRLYEMRREAVMRESRDSINGKFWPKTYDELLAITKSDHPRNAAWRQIGSYWEMVYGMVRHGIVHPDYFLESNAEGMFLFAKAAPHLDRLRADTAPHAFRNAEWVALETETGRRLFALFAGRVRRVLDSR